MFHRNDAVQFFQKDSRGIDLKKSQNGDSFWFHTDFHYFIHVLWTKCIEALRKVSGFGKFHFLLTKHEMFVREL